MYSVMSFIFWWKLCTKFNFIVIFLILAYFATFLDQTRENADLNKNDMASFILISHVLKKYMPEAISTPNLVALPITGRELDGGGPFISATNIGRIR